MKRSNYSHKFNEDLIGICLECREKLARTGFRIEKKPQLGWWPTDKQKEFIRKEWEHRSLRAIARDLGVTHNQLERYADKANLPSKSYNNKIHWKTWLDLYNAGNFPSEICQIHYKTTGKAVSRETVQAALRTQGISLTGARARGKMD